MRSPLWYLSCIIDMFKYYEIGFRRSEDEVITKTDTQLDFELAEARANLKAKQDEIERLLRAEEEGN